jgi:hypothetical protein
MKTFGLLVTFMLICFTLSPRMQAVNPPPDGGYPRFNTAEGDGALFNLSTGTANTALGDNALFSLTRGSANTATGSRALALNQADANTADGSSALVSNISGEDNVAVGSSALFSNRTASRNTAIGVLALTENDGGDNTATGYQALVRNSSGHDNTANGVYALSSSTTGFNNVAVGASALRNDTTGSVNIALGPGAGNNLTTGNNNIDIGNVGVAGESAKIRIGHVGTQNGTFVAGIHGVGVTGTAVVVGSSGQLGVAPSSQRFKDEIKPMDKASEGILALKPVTFRYKQEIDPARSPQFGLVAEDVEKVNPDLVTRDAKGEVYTVRYDAVNAMLLNEFLKEHRKVEEQEATITQLKKGMESVTARLKEQDSKIEKVSAQFEASKPAPQVVNNP